MSNGPAAANADFGRSHPEIENVIGVMRKQGFFDGCLYNQETAEYPCSIGHIWYIAATPITWRRRFVWVFSQMNAVHDYQPPS
jgi:hypothetical protein